MEAVTPNRYTQVPVNVAPDVPHYVNLALLEIGRDMALQILRLSGTRDILAALGKEMDSPDRLRARDTESETVAVSVTDEAGRRSWLEAAANGGPTLHALEQLGPGMRAQVEAGLSASLRVLRDLPEDTGLEFSVTDEAGRRSWLEVGANGGPTSHTVALLRAALALPDEKPVAAPVRVLESAGTAPNRAVWLHAGGRRRLVAAGDAHDAYFTAAGDAIIYSTPDGARYRPADLSKPAGPLLPARRIVGVGDSLTAANLYLVEIGKLLGVPVVNRGKAGWASADIALRQGGLMPVLTVAGGQIPTSGPVTVTSITPGNGWRTGVDWTLDFPGILAGVPGTLTRAGNPMVWTFTRTDAGAVVRLPAGGAAFTCTESDEYRGDIQIIFSGRNNIDAVQVARDEALMVEHLTAYARQFVLVSVINGQTEPRGSNNYARVLAVNAAKEALAPDNYYDLRSDFIARGLSLAGLPATAEDTAAIANDVPPASLMADNVHPNAVGYRVIGTLLADYISKRGWTA